MSILQGGRVYDISFSGFDGRTPYSYVLKLFMEEYARVTGIIDPYYTTIYYDYYDIDKFPYFNLPPINSSYGAGIFEFECINNPKISSTTGVTIYNRPNDDYYYITTPIGPMSYNCVYKIKDQNDYNYSTGNTIDFTKNFYFRLDARFLDTHHFYTINYFNYDKDKELSELYYSPIIFVYSDFRGNREHDKIVMFNTILDYNYRNSEDDGFINDYMDSFIPQLYTNQDQSIVLQKLTMGILDYHNEYGHTSDEYDSNIYITNSSKFTELEELVNYKKMSDYKDCWVKDKLYTNNKKFIMGVSSLKKFDYANPKDENLKSTTPYIVVIEGDTIPAANITPPEPKDLTKNSAALEFKSDEDFILSARSNTWNGVIEYSLDNKKSWHIWDGSELSGNNNQSILLRGIGNTKITGQGGWAWTFTGKHIIGKLDSLLDYPTAEMNEIVSMDFYCCSGMFSNCTSLITAPEFGTKCSSNCYQYMFSGCTSLTTVPDLKASSMSGGCYQGMFQNCTSLKVPPKILASYMAYTQSCYLMFAGCTSLTTLPKLYPTVLQRNASYMSGCYQSMFGGCTSIKLSTTKTGIYQYEYRVPITGTGRFNNPYNPLTDMFYNTGGTFKGTPAINTTYYTDHEPI